MKVGDKVKLNLSKEIEKAKSKKDYTTPSVLELWEKINGKEGVITEIIDDDKIWVLGDRTKKERRFNKDTLEIIEESNVVDRS